MNPHFLENLYERMNRPGWFWPAVLFALFVLFVAGSTAASRIEV